MTNVSSRTSVLVKMSLFIAIAVVLMYFDFPIIPAFPWLKIDLSELPLLIGTFAFGPVAGIVMEFLKNIIIVLLRGTGTGGVGDFANFTIGASLVAPAGFIYLRNKSRKNAVIGMLVGAVIMAVVGAVANYYVLLPLFGFGSKSIAWKMNYIMAGVIPFNLIKAIIVSAVTFIVYKRVSIVMRIENKENVKSVNQN